MVTHLEHINGLFIGQLTDEELNAFNQAVRDGLAQRDYSGVAGLLGLGKVRILSTGEEYVWKSA